MFVVGYEGNSDPLKPHNWPFWKRVLLTANVGLIALVVGLAAAIDSAALRQASADFGGSDVAETLATGLVSAIFHLPDKARSDDSVIVPLRLWSWGSYCRAAVRDSGTKPGLPSISLHLHDVHHRC